jgi:hypothetical protein
MHLLWYIREAASGYYTESLTIVGDVCGENHIVAITKLYNMLTTAPHYFVNSWLQRKFEINLTRWNVESLTATLCDCPTPEPGCQAAYVVVIGLRFFVLVLTELLTSTVLKLSHNSTCGSWYMRIIRGISSAVTSWQNNVEIDLQRQYRYNLFYRFFLYGENLLILERYSTLALTWL